MDARQEQLKAWCAAQYQLDNPQLSIVSGDASFRRYFRLHLNDQTLIAMDAPPEKEDSSSFVAIARHWHQQGIQVPEIIALDLTQGFMLLSDLGDKMLMQELKPDAPSIEQGTKYYRTAMLTLTKIQGLDHPKDYPLPKYDISLLHQEMRLFTDWLLDKKLNISRCEEDEKLFTKLFNTLADNALKQPQVCVHRDYHCRNLMVIEAGLGVIDFQDAVIGPITYDLVSLLKDCYIKWPRQQVIDWCRDYYQLANDEGLISDYPFEDFLRDFDLMGLQRHLKAAGIFARLSLRDGKHGYLKDIPRTVSYLVDASGLYPETLNFHHWLKQHLVPELGSLQQGAA